MSGWESLVSNSLFQVMAWSLIHFLWQGAVVAVVLALALTLIPRRFSQVRYLAAASAMALMLLLPILTGWMLWSGTSVDAPLSMGAAPVESISIQNWSTPEEAGPQPGLASQTALQARVKPWLPVVVFLWLAGVALLSLRNFGGLLGASTLSRRGTFAPPEKWEIALRRLARRMGVTQTVRLLGSHLVSVPMVVGWLRPVVLVPAGAFTGLPPRELEAILAHELAHIRRYDYFVNLVQTFVETFLFYHPAVWWVSRQIREERENCCDDIAVASCGDVKIYAEALARMESLRLLAPNFAMGADGGSLLSRISRLVGKSSRRKRSSRWIPGVVTLIGTAALGMLILGVGAEQTGAELAKRSRSEVAAVRALEGTQVRATRVETPPVPAPPTYSVVVGSGVGVKTLLASSDRGWRGSSSNQGRWEATYDDGHVWVDIRREGSRWSTSLDVEELGVNRRQIEDLLDEKTIELEFPREAGTFLFEGEVEKRGAEASGTFRFRPDPEYVEKMEALGYDGDDVEDIQMELGVHDVTTSYVRALAETGYKDLPLHRVVEFKIHGIGPEYVRGMAEAGYDDLRAERIVEFKIHGISPEYVRGMAEAGYEGLRAERIVEFKIHGISPEYVRGMAEAGYDDLRAEKIVEFKIHGISPEYVQGMAQTGYADLTAERIVEFKIHGINPDYVQGMAQTGYKDLPAERIVEFKIHGISPGYVKGMADAGYGDLPAARIVEFKIHGISADYLAGLAELGYGDIGASKVIEFKIHGVSADSIRDLQERGLTDLTPDEIIEIHISGVDRILRKKTR